MQCVPSRDRAYPGMQRWTTHSPDRQETSATPSRAVQSWPIGENGVRGNTHPPPKDFLKSGWYARPLGPGTLTTLQIMCGVDALPGPCAPSKHAAGCPAIPLLCARAAANPALFDCGLAGGARACHAVAVADYIRRSAGWDTRGWVL
jgi:hypothetical protein